MAKAADKLRAYTRQSIYKTSPRGFVESLAEESDRGAIILMITMIEDALADSLRLAMKGATDKEAAKLLKFDGPAGTFSAKIKLCHSLGLIRDDIRDSLEIAREMRNACAHCRTKIGFETPELRAMVALIMKQDSATVEKFTTKQVRDAFMLNCGLIAMAIMSPDAMKFVDESGPIVLNDLLNQVGVSFPHVGAMWRDIE